MKKKYILLCLWLIGIFLYEGIPFLMHVHIPKIPESQIIYDRAHIEIGEIVTDEKYRHREFQNYPEFLKKSVIAIEDRRFYFHEGIDFIALIRAVKNNFSNNKIQGASTIENQLIRNSFWLNEKRTFSLKLKEFLFALSLSREYKKNEILNLYLNRVSFWYLNYGFESAAQFYYGKSSTHLTKAETIGLITIMKNPNFYNPLTQRVNFDKRFRVLTETLHKRNIITSQEMRSILDEPLSFSKWTPDLLPYVKDFLQNSSSQTSLHSTIDFYLTQNIDHLARETIVNLAWKNVGDYAILIVDRKTMQLKVMIWGENYSAPSGQVNSTLARRQPGSTLKPFLYALSFKNLWFTPSSRILDLPVQFPTADGNLYAPKNYSLTYAWEVSLAESLSQSLNIPAVKLLNEVGEEKFLSFLRLLGISSLQKTSDYYGLSLALWSGEVNMFELLRAYGIFAKNGQLCSIVYLQWETSTCKNVIEEKYTSQIYDILSNRYFKLAWFPINSNLDFEGKEIFVKTGTSRNFKDNWTLGFNEDYLVGVWVGNKDGSEMKGVSGATWAGEIFRKIIMFLDTKNPIWEKVITLENTSQEYLEIISPLPGSVFAIDEFIPKEQQKIQLTFASNIPHNSFEWSLDGKKITSSFIEVTRIKSTSTLTLKLFLDNHVVWEKSFYISLAQP